MDINQRDLEEFKHLAEMLRFYLTIVVSTTSFTVTATGIAVANFLKQEQGASGYRRLVLVIPAGLCLWLGGGFRNWMPAAVELRKRIDELRDALGFGLAARGGVLIGALDWLGWLLIATGLCLLFWSVGSAIVEWRSRLKRTVTVTG